MTRTGVFRGDNMSGPMLRNPIGANHAASAFDEAVRPTLVVSLCP